MEADRLGGKPGQWCKKNEWRTPFFTSNILYCCVSSCNLALRQRGIAVTVVNSETKLCE